jgi:hypothetical protein
MLRQNQRERPTAAALLASPEIQSKLHLDDVVTSFSQNAQNRNPAGDLIDTIKVPQNGNLRRLGNVLPKPCYPDVRPNSPSSWIVAEQHKFKQAAMPPPPPAAGPPVTAAIREPVTSSVPAVPTAAPTRAPLAPIAEDANSARPAHHAAPAQKVAYPSNAAARPQVRRAPAPPAPPAPPAAAAAAPAVAHVPGAYNRGRYVGNGVPAAAAAGYPSRVVQRRIW